ncbi:unnamed protein product [Caenorhabditis sp. 36 PRJEB53466]|nr:unnamed protein product [Caenorhabditis sp. 36 PRJEB53466]
MMYVIMWSHRDDYNISPFWTIYTIDCVFGAIHIFFDIFYFRLTIFVPQVCESFSFFLRSNPFLIHISFPLCTTAWQLSYMQVSMTIVILTNIVLISNWALKRRVRPGIECRISLSISIEYLCVGLVFCYLHIRKFAFDDNNFIYVLVFFTWDAFNCLSPIIMTTFNGHLRKQVFSSEPIDDDIFHPR